MRISLKKLVAISLSIVLFFGLFPNRTLAQESDQVFESNPSNIQIEENIQKVDKPLENPDPVLEFPNSEDSSNQVDEKSKGDTEIVDDPKEQENETTDITNEPDTTPQEKTSVKPPSLKPDDLTGALIYNYPLQIPPGRNNFAPNPSLVYNSQNNDNLSPLGYGWSFDIPSIERQNKTGTDKLYSENYFSSSEVGELVMISDNEFGARIENGEFKKFQFQNNSWLVTDKAGTVYKYGVSSASRQDNAEQPNQVYKWMIEEVRDVNENFISFEYFKDQGQIYPSKIFYTGHGLENGVFSIDFLRENRIDNIKSYRTAFLVQNNYRISEININISGSWVRKYSLSYIFGDNGVRSMLQKITESGRDEAGTIVTLPATVFNYQAPTPGWTQDTTSWTIPDIVDENRSFIDINGDSRLDFVKSFTDPDSVLNKESYLETGNNSWVASENLKLPLLLGMRETRGGAYSRIYDSGSRLADFNGDQFPDMLQGLDVNPGFAGSNYQTFINNSGQGWSESASWIPAFGFSETSGSDYTHSGGSINDYGARVLDLNGDSLVDITRQYNGNFKGTQLNTGTGFAAMTEAWNTPVNLRAPKTQITDVNGDGLPDVLYYSLVGTTTQKNAYINTGTGQWNNDSNLVTPIDFTGPNDMGVRFMDVNGDGLVDAVIDPTNDNGGDRHTWVGTGVGWTPRPSLMLPIHPNSLITGETQVGDFNYDGLTDFIYVINYGSSKVAEVWQANGKQPDLLSKVISPLGAITSIEYQRSAKYKDAAGNSLNPELPVNFTTVKSISINDGNANLSTDNYSYEGGKYYYGGYLDRKPAGFHKIIKTDSQGNQFVSYFHQGDGSNSSTGEYADHSSKIGKSYRQDIFDAAGNKFMSTISQWENHSFSGSRELVNNTKVLTQNYNGDSTHKDKAETYSYDLNNGNLIQKTDWGEVVGDNDGTFQDVGNDKIISDFSYATNGNGRFKLTSSLLSDSSGTKLKESKFYYDNLPFGQLSVGNQTKQELWKSGNSYVSTEKAYDDHGLVSYEIDARGKLTNYSYDSFNLYPVTIINPLNQSTQFTYDYSLGKPKQTTDANNLVNKIIYDGIDRIVEEQQSDVLAPENLVTKTTYSYTFQTLGTKNSRKDYLDNQNFVENYEYTDGLGRAIQTRKEAETSGNFITTDVIYNNLGLVRKRSLPYFSEGNSRTTPTTDANLFSIMSYDVLGRITSIQTSIGQSTNTYGDLKLTVTDNLGKTKHSYFDVFGRLIKVEEVNLGNSYFTNYSYDGAGNLVTVTDAQGNLRKFSYDGLGQRTSAEDLHAQNDLTFGLWTYDYDNNGNLVSSTNPNGQIVDYAYDDLNRVLSENFTGIEGVEQTYIYDTCQNGITKLCSVESAEVATNYTYDLLGRIKTEQKIIDGITYESQYSYDRLDNQISNIYPDSSEIKYFYNTAGLLESVQRKESTDQNYINVVSNFDYGPHGQITLKQNSNGTKTENIYDQAKMYRLNRKLTTKITSGFKLQDLNYTYDANNNILQIVDDSQTNSKKIINYAYDDLNRLISESVSGAVSGQPNHTNTFQYDSIGNMVASSNPYIYESDFASFINPHAPISIGSIEYKYDKNGNVLEMTDLSLRPDQVNIVSHWKNSWDYKNQLVSSIADSKESIIDYDYRGQRIKIKAKGSVNLFPFENYSIENGIVSKHVMAGDNLLANIKGTGVFANNYTIHTEHLGGTNIVTNGAGELAQLVDYYPYGKIRLDERSENFNEKRKFAGHEYDAENGFTYMQARYYNGSTGKFLSQDPIFWEMPKEYLLDPQQQNSYSYARNNPVNRIDPDGRLNMIIPGTGYDPNGWSKDSTAKDLYNNVQNTFKDGKYTVIMNIKSLWSGDDNKVARENAATNFSKIINGHKFENGETLNIVAHSHGGNVAAILSQKVNRKIDNLVTLGTPVRFDYNFNKDKIVNHINVYSRDDFVQLLGGGGLSAGSFLLGCFSFCKGSGGLPALGEFGLARRNIDGATNINASNITNNPATAHSSLWKNSAIWKLVREKLGK